MALFLIFFLASPSFLVFTCFVFLFSPFLLRFSISGFFIPVACFLCFVSYFPFDLCLPSVCVVIGTTYNVYVVVYLGGEQV